VKEELLGESTYKKVFAAQENLRNAQNLLADAHESVSEAISLQYLARDVWFKQERARVCLALHKAGCPFSAIGAAYRLTGYAVADIVRKERERLASRGVPAYTDSWVPLGELGLSNRTYNSLTNAGHRTLGNVAMLTEEEVLRTRNFGRKSFKEIREKIQMHGLRFGMTAEEVDAVLSEDGKRKEIGCPKRRY